MSKNIQQARILDALSLAFLLLPNFLFTWGWHHVWLALPASLVFLYLTYEYLKTSKASVDAKPEQDSISPAALFGCFAIALVWVAFSGIGGFGLQNSDYTKHNAIFIDLMRLPWPAHYPSTIVTEGQPRFLVYALAHYLPAALVGKFAGWKIANYFLFVWDIFGTGLALTWVIRIARLQKWYFILLFPLYSGLDLLGHYVSKGALPKLGDHIEWWESYVQFSSNTTMLFWVPQHAIAGWLAAALTAHSIRLNKGMLSVVPFAFIAIWSPLVTMGLFPFVFAGLLFKEIRGTWSWGLLAGAAVILLLNIPFFGANDMSFPHGFFDGFDGKASSISKLILFYGIELLVFLIPIKMLLRGIGKNEQLLLVVSAICLFLFPTYKLGAAHDLAMRGSVSALFLLACFVLRTLHSGDQRRIAYQVLAIAFAIGAFTGLSEISRSINFYRHEPPAEESVKGIAQLGQDEFVQQYLGKEDTFFFKYFAKKVADN